MDRRVRFCPLRLRASFRRPNVANCVDCTSQDFPLAGGSFLESGLDLGLKAGDGFGASLIGGYRHYFAGASVAGEVQLGFAFWYW